MPKRKNFNRRALSCTSRRTHLEGRRSVELMNLSFKPVRASRAQGFQGPHGGSQLVLTLYRIYFFVFQMCNRLPELMKNGDTGIFPVYYSLNSNKNITTTVSPNVAVSQGNRYPAAMLVTGRPPLMLLRRHPITPRALGRRGEILRR